MEAQRDDDEPVSRNGERTSAIVEAVGHAARAVSKARDLDGVLAAAVDQIMDLGASSSHVLLAAPDEATLVLAAHRRVGDAALRLLERVRLDDPLLAARAAKTRELQLVNDVSLLDPALTAARALRESEGVGAIVCAPLLAQGRLLGVLTWTMTEVHAFSSVDRRAIAALADVFATGIANARAVDRDAYERLVLAIAERHRLEHTLGERETRLRAVFDHSCQFIGLLSADGILLEANKTALDFIARSREEVVGRPFWKTEWWSSPADRERLRDAVRRAARGEQVRFETTHASADGRVIHVEFSLSPVHNDAGEVILLVPEGRDITVHKQLETLREEWISIVAHDLRQPINAIQLWAEMLARASVRDASEALSHIRASVAQLSRMTQDLLEVSRLEAGHLTLDRKRTDVVALARAVVARSLEDGRAADVSIDGDIPFLDVDAGRIEQVLGNLLSNAQKYGSADAPIDVALRRAGGDVRLTVSNHGAGIDPSELRQLFQRFHRTRTAMRSRTAGIGLGLYISRALVEAHGGRLSVESVPGAKTTFAVTLPVPS